jgi:predicted Zn-dependent protease
MMMNTKSTPSRRAFLAGAAALVAVAVSATTAFPAFADSHSQERQIGQQVFNDLRSKNQIVYQSAYYPVLREVGHRISDAAQPHWYTMNFIIVKGNKANAFSVPGGNVYVNEALLRSAENRDELAAVLGHETTHIVLGHVMKRIQQAQAYNLGLGILSLFVRTQLQATMANLLANYSFLNFNRQQEYQADHGGAYLAAKAGYNPWGEIWFFRRLTKLYGDVGFEQYVADHPSAKDRIARLEGAFRSDPATFYRYADRMPVPSNGLPTAGANTRLVVNSN